MDKVVVGEDGGSGAVVPGLPQLPLENCPFLNAGGVPATTLLPCAAAGAQPVARLGFCLAV